MILPLSIVLVACTLAVVPYLLARRLLLARSDEQSRELAGSVLFRVGALHSLVLALVFAQELLNYNDIRKTTTREAAFVGDVYYDLARYGADDRPREALREYTRRVLEVEWALLAREARLDEGAWSAWKSAYLAVLDLRPETLRQEALRSFMLQRVREISDLRIAREAVALAGATDLFLYTAVAGIVIISIGYFAFPPTSVSITLLLLFGLYVGLLVYFIVEFANPFSGLGYVEPVRMQRLYEGMLNDQRPPGAVGSDSR